MRESRLRNAAFPGFDPGLAPKTESEGYAIQDALNELLVADLGPVIGYKIGCTTPDLQAFMNIPNPCEGAVFAATEVADGGDLDLSRYVRVGLECEIGVRLGAGLDPREGTIDRERVAVAIAACFTSIEIVDERYGDFRTVGTATLIADNFMDAGIVRGPERTGVDPRTLDAVRGQTLVNGTAIGGGTGRDVLGHPLEAVVWLANALAARGLPLRAGTIITTGSMVKPFFPEPGDVITIANDVLGDVTVVARGSSQAVL